ncbi:MAG: bifunctional transaldolase/phosoglucose isomerase [Actinomycetota bacterium]
MNPLHRLHDSGQGIWLDFLRRGLIQGGELARMIQERSLTGVTSNPSIFRKAIGGSSDYDEAIARVAQQKRDAREVFYELALEDIRGAADVLRPVYDATSGRDGFVSFELEACLARDTSGSISKGKELFSLLDRPNVMIKVPGTEEGVEAVEELTAAGVNVNITLLFTVHSYERVAAAYIRGIRRRVDDGLPVDRIASVASFFVSRVDGAVDALLPPDSKFRGKAAVANAKIAYQRFLDIFSGPVWEKLAEAGARVQRPLWASTGTKDPAYSDVMYVEELVGADTVNTMPQQTMDAFLDHGKVRPNSVTDAIPDAILTLTTIADLGIDLIRIGRRLEQEGIDAFAKDFDGLLATIESKIERICAGRLRWTASLGDLQPVVDARIRELTSERVISRIWSKDHTVWSPDPTEIIDRLGWLTVADMMQGRVAELEEFAKKVVGDGYSHAVVLGMGGSSLAAEVFSRTFREGALMDLRVLDSTHPAQIAALEAELPLERTIFLVASKSGTTVESISHFGYFFSKTNNPDQFVAITDPGTRLEKLARLMGFREVFTNPADIGGRYSALSLFGLVPAALVGVDLGELLDRAEEMACACHHCVPIEQNPGAWLGVAIGVAAAQGRDKITLVLPERVAGFGAWVEQLLAESTGKAGTGIIPIVDEDLGPPEVYGEDRLFVGLGESEALAILKQAGHPVIEIDCDESIALGGEFFRWEFATAVAGHILRIQPFDQPDVQSAKDATKKILSEKARSTGFDNPAALLELLREGDYVAFLAYLPRTAELESTLQGLRLKIRDGRRVATTVGLGPRYLHSTGQLHKGGPNTGVFFEIVEPEWAADLAIPDATYSFGQLIDAQALGDYSSLEQAGRRVARVTLDQLKEVIR